MLSRISRPFVRYLSGMLMTSSSRSLSSLSVNSFPGFRKKELAANQLELTTRQLKTSASSSAEKEETEKKLLETLTQEFCERLTGKITSKRFRLKNIQNELERLYKKNFPLPESLTEEQWTILMEFNEMDLRVYYLDSLVQGVDNLEKLRGEDAARLGSLLIPEELLKNSDPEQKEKIKNIQFEHERLRQVGELAPTDLCTEQWDALFSCTGSRQILNTFRYFITKRLGKMHDLIEKRASSSSQIKERESRIAERLEEQHIVYCLGQNNIFLRFYPQAMDAIENARVISSFQFGHPIVIDMSFLKAMTYHEVKSLCYREIPFALSMNRGSKEPQPIYITNYDHNCNKCKTLNKAFPNLLHKDFPAVVTDKSYLDLFPPERLLYLTPDSRTDLLEYNPDDVYIIGGIVETAGDVPYTLTKAKKLGIRHARLPTKRTVGITPVLNVEHAVVILNDFIRTRDWFYSFRWIPPRFFKNKLKGATYTSEMEHIYFAQHALNPNSNQTLQKMTPKEYRARYIEIMRKVDRSPNFRPDPDKYRFKAREAREERKFGIFSALE